MSHELWITRLCNHSLAALGNGVLNLVHSPAKDPANPWTDWMVCEILVVLFIVGFFAFAKSRFSVDRPGKVQHVLELTYEFIHASAEEVVGHGGARYLPCFGTS